MGSSEAHFQRSQKPSQLGECKVGSFCALHTIANKALQRNKKK